MLEYHAIFNIRLKKMQSVVILSLERSKLLAVWLIIQVKFNDRVVIHTFWRFFLKILTVSLRNGQTQLPRGLRRRSVADRLLKFWVRIPPGAWMSVCC